MSFRNLTGNVRIIYDSCIDLYNAVQKWKSSLSDSYPIIHQICVLKLKEMNNLIKDNSEDCNWLELNSLSSELQNKMENMELIVKKMERCSTRINGIFELSDLHLSSSSFSSVDHIPFKNFSLSKFCAVAEEIASMHREELELKKKISKEICILTTEKKALALFEACWKYEPHINQSRLNTILDSLICELNLLSELLNIEDRQSNIKPDYSFEYSTPTNRQAKSSLR